MSKFFGFSGDADFLQGESIFSPLDCGFELYFPPSKKCRVTAPFIFSNSRWQQQQQKQKQKVSIEVLPDECLFEILRRLPGDQERSSCASVSKRWLSLLSNITRNELCSKKSDDDEASGCLTRVLEGKKATDTHLAAISVGTAGHGGLGELVIRGSNSVTDLGLTLIARGCPSLLSLSMWNVPFVGDLGLSEVAKGCNQLEKLELSHCHGVSDKGLIALAKGCVNLREVSVESCPKIGNEWLFFLGRHCPNLKSVSIKNCPLVGDRGIGGLLSTNTSYSLSRLKIQTLMNVTDLSLAVVGHYGKALNELVLENLPRVTEKGFWVMGKAHGLLKLRSFMVSSCQGVTDSSIGSVSRGCPNLTHLSVKKSTFLSDNGVVSCAMSALSLERVEFEECDRITESGFFGLLVCGKRLKSVSVSSCLGMKELGLGSDMALPPCESLLSLSVKNCPLFGDANLAVLGTMCPKLHQIELNGLREVTDEGLFRLFQGCDAGLTAVNLGKCPELTDKVVSALAETHGWTLRVLNLNSCIKIGDGSLISIAENCMVLNDLHVSNSAVSDIGILALSQAKQLNLEILSLSGCSNLTDMSLSALRNLESSLAGLNLQQCHGISRNAVDSFTELLWNCDIIS